MDIRRIKLPSKHEEWLAVRRMGITGTDLAAIAGVSKYGTPISVFFDKQGKAPVTEENEAMMMGKILEEPIARIWAAKNPDYKIQKVNAIIQHKKTDWMLANVDRHIVSPHEGILEVKNVGTFMASEWGSEEEPDVPKEYYLQLLWYMTVTGLKVGKFAALLGGNRLMERDLHYDKEISEALIEMAHRFWNDHVLTGEPPAMDGESQTSEMLNKMFNEPATILINLPQAEMWARKKMEIDVRYKAVEKELEEAKNNIRLQMGNDCTQATCGAYEASWKVIDQQRFNEKQFKKDHPDLHGTYLKDTSHRRLLIKKRKI